MKKVVLFDFHNTLATCDAWLELEIKTLPGLVLQRLGAKGGMTVDGAEQMEEATRLFRELRADVRDSGVELSAVEGTRRVLERMGVRPPAAEIEEAVAQLEYELLPQVAVIEGAGEALDRLRDRGYTLGVVSSAGFPPFVEMSLEKLTLRSYFSAVFTSTGEGLYKSDPELFRRAVRLLGAAPDEAVHVGDHPLFDVQSAMSAGLSAVWFRANSGRTAQIHDTRLEEIELAGMRADTVVHSLDEVPDAVEQLS